MESNVKSESNSLSCCVVCLRDDIKVFKENDVSENFINIYQNLVQNEVKIPSFIKFAFKIKL